ncbi:MULTISPECIES: hypothetical protein [Nocardiaceae]|uniref:hypothetical protein n=1 Tax=Nocardiaceae TaxID=85025 RepID=UPI000AB84106|nr:MULTISPECIES: hypothetical protein [Rhodococcus]
MSFRIRFSVGAIPAEKNFSSRPIRGLAKTGASEDTFAAPRALATLVTDQLAGARGDAESRSVAAELDADLVLMAVGGLAQGMLQGYSTRHSAEQLIEHLLDRVLQ